MTAISNVLRIAVAGIWTAILGIPLLVTLYSTYAYGLLRAKLGSRETLDRILERNAYLAGAVAGRLWSTVLLALAGIRVKARELAPIDWKLPHVICANHASVFDILALVRVVPPPFRFVAKRELLKWPIIGWALRPAGQIVIDRGDNAGAVRSIAQAAVRKIRGQVIFFVEGTRTRTGRLQALKKGAFHFSIDCEVRVLPTAITGSYSVLARVPWWRLQPGRDIAITFCRPIEPPAAESKEKGAVEDLLERTRYCLASIIEPDAAGLVEKRAAN